MFAHARISVCVCTCKNLSLPCFHRPEFQVSMFAHARISLFHVCICENLSFMFANVRISVCQVCTCQNLSLLCSLKLSCLDMAKHGHSSLCHVPGCQSSMLVHAGVSVFFRTEILTCASIKVLCLHMPGSQSFMLHSIVYIMSESVCHACTCQILIFPCCTCQNLGPSK